MRLLQRLLFFPLAAKVKDVTRTKRFQVNEGRVFMEVKSSRENF